MDKYLNEQKKKKKNKIVENLSEIRVQDKDRFILKGNNV